MLAVNFPANKIHAFGHMTRAEVAELLKCIQLCLFSPSAVFFNALV